MVAALAAPSAVYAQTVTCADGTTSEAGRGACSHHGGIAKTRAPKKRAEPRTTTTTTRAKVLCNDGTYSSATGRGACSRHGGVAGDVVVDRDAPRTTQSKVRCNDGTYSSATGRGACSRHGGVAGDAPRTRDTQARKSEPRRTETRTTEEPRGNWLDDFLGRDDRVERERKTDRPWWGNDEPRPGEPLARCMDGSLSYSKTHRGTCSHHGGVREWLDD